MLAWPYCHGWDEWKPPLLFALDMKLHELANLTKTIKNLQGGSAKRQALQMPQADLHEFAPSKLGDVGWADITWIAPCSWNRTGKMTDWTVSWRIAQGSVQSILKVCTQFCGQRSYLHKSLATAPPPGVCAIIHDLAAMLAVLLALDDLSVGSVAELSCLLTSQT